MALLPSLSTSASLLPGLLLLETVLSADNALALASMVKPYKMEAERQRLLNWGLTMAIGLRLLAVATAGIVIHYPLVRLVGGGYLIWLALSHFRDELESSCRHLTPTWPDGLTPQKFPARQEQAGIAVMLLLAGTNLAFSLDSICAALALTDNVTLVMIAAAVGVVVLRVLAGWILRWMERFPNLANAGYLTVLAAGTRLVMEQWMPALTPSDPLMIGGMLVFLGWGWLQPQPARS